LVEGQVGISHESSSLSGRTKNNLLN